MKKLIGMLLVLSILFSILAVAGTASAATIADQGMGTIVITTSDLGTGKVMPSVSVSFRNTKTGETKNVKTSAKTGQATVHLRAGKWTAYATAPKGYNAPKSASFTIKTGAAISRNFSMLPVFNVKVTVVDSKGKIVPNAQVSICNAKATTNSKGVATIKKVEYGKNTVKVNITKNGKKYIAYDSAKTLKGKSGSNVTLKIKLPAQTKWAVVSEGFTEIIRQPICYKPVIYLYSKTQQDVNVKLGIPENVTVSYPKYPEEDGWNVTVHTDGSMTDKATGRNLYSLYWEGLNDIPDTIGEGFVVAGDDTAAFLEEKLAYLGLNEREIEEFIIYWLPQMKERPFNYIRFATEEEINESMPLTTEPSADKVLRVWMVFAYLGDKIEVPEQKLEPVDRAALDKLGFYAVEWGGTEICPYWEVNGESFGFSEAIEPSGLEEGCEDYIESYNESASFGISTSDGSEGYSVGFSFSTGGGDTIE